MNRNISKVWLIILTGIIIVVSSVLIIKIMDNNKLKERTTLLEKRVVSLKYNPYLNNIRIEAIDTLRSAGMDFIVYFDRSDCSDCELFDPLFNQYLNEKQISTIYRVDVKDKKMNLNDKEWGKFKKKYGFSQTPAFIYYSGNQINSIVEQEDDKPLSIKMFDKWYSDTLE